MASAVGAGAAVGSVKAPLQLSGTKKLKALVNEAATLHGVTTSTMLRRALVLYAGLAEGVPADLAKQIEREALRQDERRCYSAPILRDDVSSRLSKGPVQLELDIAAVTPAQAGEG